MEFPESDAYVSDGILGKDQVLLLAAPAWSMKSVVAINMAHSLATGEDFLCKFKVQKPIKVLFLDKEIGLRGFNERARLFYPEKDDLPENFSIVSKEHKEIQFKIDDKGSLKPLKDMLKSLKPNVVIMDCLNPFLSQEEGEQAFSRAADNIAMLQFENQDHGLSFIIIHHMREVSEGTDPLNWYNIRGHGKLVDWPDTRITMMRDMKKVRNKVINKLSFRFMIRHGGLQEDLTLRANDCLRLDRKKIGLVEL